MLPLPQVLWLLHTCCFSSVKCTSRLSVCFNYLQLTRYQQWNNTDTWLCVDADIEVSYLFWSLVHRPTIRWYSHLTAVFACVICVVSFHPKNVLISQFIYLFQIKLSTQSNKNDYLETIHVSWFPQERVLFSDVILYTFRGSECSFKIPRHQALKSATSCRNILKLYQFITVQKAVTNFWT